VSFTSARAIAYALHMPAGHLIRQSVELVAEARRISTSAGLRAGAALRLADAESVRSSSTLRSTFGADEIIGLEHNKSTGGVA
jgi:hypothetical protein